MPSFLSLLDLAFGSAFGSVGQDGTTGVGGHLLGVFLGFGFGVKRLDDFI